MPAPAPTRKRATSSIGFCVADRPMRSRRSPHERRQPLERQRQVAAALVRRQRVDLVDDHRARGRQHRAAGLASRAGCRATPASSPGCAAAARRMRCALGRRRVAGAHRRCGSRRRAGPARAAPRGCRPAAPRGCAGCRSTAPSAARRRRPASRPAARPSTPCRTSSSIAARNAASVLPEPVGAAISTCRPAWIAGQACACAAVGAAKLLGEPRRDRRMKQGGRAHGAGVGLRQRLEHRGDMTALLPEKQGASGARGRYPRQLDATGTSALPPPKSILEHWTGRQEPPIAAAVLLIMRKVGKSNDWWDWGVILLLVAGVHNHPVGERVVGPFPGQRPRAVVTARTATTVSPERERTYKWSARGSRICSSHPPDPRAHFLLT